MNFLLAVFEKIKTLVKLYKTNPSRNVLRTIVNMCRRPAQWDDASNFVWTDIRTETYSAFDDSIHLLSVSEPLFKNMLLSYLVTQIGRYASIILSA